MAKTQFKAGDVCMFTKIGSMVRLICKGNRFFGKQTWQVERIDTGQRMIVTQTGLVKNEPVGAVKMPPRDFSNAMNFIYKDYDFRGWETSKEWALWNSGRGSMARELQYEAQHKADDAQNEARVGFFEE